MEKEVQRWKQEEVEEQEEEEETTLLVRKSRNENDSKTTEIASVDVEQVSNGVSKSNGHSETAANGAKNEELILGEEQKTEELDGVLENEAEAINGEQESENLVFFDETEGIWKCRICTWTYQNGSVCVDHIQNHKGLFHKLMNVKTLNFESEGLESASPNLGEKQIVKDSEHNKLDSSSLDFIENSSTPAVNDRYEGVLKNDSFPSPNQTSQTSLQERGTVYKSSNEIESAEVDLDNLEVAEFDIEGVLQKQTTHDLFCPNCNSCITKRVILRKRKRRIRVSDEEAKRNKREADSKLGTGSVQSSIDRDPVHHIDEVGDNDNQLPAADEDERGRGPDVFRCLSCFSFFIPTGNGFKLFQLFGDKSGNENVRDEQAPTVKKNWFTSMFASNKNETAVVQDATMEQFNASTKDELKESEFNINSASDPSVTTPPQRTQVTNGKYAEDAFSLSQQDGLKMLISTNNGSLTVENSDGGQISNQTIQSGASTDTDAIKSSPPSDSVFKASDVDGILNISVSIPHEDDQDIRATILTESVENKHANFTSNDSGQVHSTEVSQHIITKTKFEVHSGDSLKVDNVSALKDDPVQQGKDTVINIDRQPAGLSQTLQDTISPTETASLLLPATQISVAGRERTEERKELEIEVIKSVLYGGLAESITSLSVVSSAAGGGATTLNTLALGAANLIGGLFIICHNLWELKSDHREQVANQVSHEAPDQRDRYKELLGRRRNFILHFVVSIISYIIFGSVAPVVYGFSFSKTDDKQLKLIVTAASSLLCIILLAVGRAYVSRPPKPYWKSVITFVILGFMVSGVSYAAGELVERLLEKLGLFQSSSVSNFFMDGMSTTGLERASY